jgi:hypothetical protein
MLAAVAAAAAAAAMTAMAVAAAAAVVVVVVMVAAVGTMMVCGRCWTWVSVARLPSEHCVYRVAISKQL